jgi:hypothetical protein
MDARSGVVTSYTSDGIRRGGSRAVDAGRVAAGVAELLRAAECPATAFGQVTGAAELAVAVGRARDAHTATGTAVKVAHLDLDGRSRGVAGSGDGLTAETATQARTAAPAPTGTV